MELMEFQKVLSEFRDADTSRKIDMYMSLEGLTQTQYTDLLKSFPMNELHKLEAALG